MLTMPQGHLTMKEREIIALLRVNGRSMNEIGQQIGRDKSTVSREIKRNATGGIYVPLFAQEIAEKRRKNAKQFQRMRYPGLLNYVKSKLKAGWSPEDIANRLPEAHPHNENMRAAAPTIYAWVEHDRRQGGIHYRYLRYNRGRKRRRRRGRERGRAGRIIGRVGIEHRPEVVESRERFGDWEGDTMVGSGKSGCLVTQVERKSRYLVAVKVDSKTAPAVGNATLQAFRKVPKRLRKTMTLDNGREFAMFPQLEDQLHLNVYFADGYAPWQRGANENTNGLLRQFFPKGTKFCDVSPEEVAKVVKLMNNRPRRCLGYRTPREVYREAVKTNSS